MLFAEWCGKHFPTLSLYQYLLQEQGLASFMYYYFMPLKGSLCRKKKYNHYFLRYPVTVTVKTDPNAYLNAPSVTICPLARLSCRRLASAMLQESPDGESTKMAVNLFRTQNSPDTNVDSEGGQEVPNTSSRYNILRQLFKVAKCCQTLRETNISQENVGILGCSGFEGGNGIEVSITVWYVCYSYSC